MRKGIVVSLLLHAVAIAPLLFLLAPPTAPPSSQASPQTRFIAQTVNIETLQAATPPPIQAAAAPPVQAPEPLVSESKQAEAVAPVQPETIEPAELKPPPEPEPVKEVERLPPAAPAPVLQPEAAEAEPVPEQVAAVEPQPEPPAPKPEPIPEPPPPEVVAREQPRVIEPQPPAEQERVAALSQPATPGAAAPDEPAPSSADAGGTPSPDYLLQIRTLLEENKQYPPMAQRYGMEGEVLLWFVLDRQGNVLDYRIDQSSGNAMLDQEVERLIEEISRFPPVPPEVGADTLELLVPVTFRLAG